MNRLRRLVVFHSQIPRRSIPRWTILSSWFFLCSALVVFTSSTWACRYNVRDVGFVQFGPSPYHLYAVINDRIPPADADTIQQIAFAALLDSNIDLQVVNVDREPDHSVLAYLPSSPQPTFPAWILISPDGNMYQPPPEPQLKSLKEAVWDTVDRLVSSPLREEIAQNVIRNYGVILMIEGDDEKENQRVRPIIDEVIAQIERNLAALPKLVDRPPVLQILSRAEFDRERELLWSLNADPKDGNPKVAVIYGRCRRVGSLLSGHEITRNALSGLVSVIGLSCECGLDRSWIMGTMIPFRWTNEYQEEAAQQLGFDPDSPIIKTEISQIMAISSRQSGGGGSGDLLMGYGEITLDFDSLESEDSNEGRANESEKDIAETRIVDPSPQSDPESILALSYADACPPSSPPLRDEIVDHPQSSPYRGIFAIVLGLLVVSLSGGFWILWKAKG